MSWPHTDILCCPHIPLPLQSPALCSPSLFSPSSFFHLHFPLLSHLLAFPFFPFHLLISLPTSSPFSSSFPTPSIPCRSLRIVPPISLTLLFLSTLCPLPILSNLLPFHSFALLFSPTFLYCPPIPLFLMFPLLIFNLLLFILEFKKLLYLHAYTQ